MKGFAPRVMPIKENMMQELLRAETLAKALSISKSTLWRWCKSKTNFPQPRKISQGVTVWFANEVQEWLNSHRQKEVSINEGK